MSGRLGPLLRDVAEAAPPVRLPDGLFDKARRQHRRRRATAIAATLGVLALLVLALPAGLRTSPVRPGAGVEGLPTRLVHAHGHTATVGRAPLPAVLAVFSGADSNEGFLGDRYPLTLVGAGDAYRTYNRPEWGTNMLSTQTFLLSPDGRYLAMPYGDGPSPQTRLLDVTTGRVRTLTGGGPLAWAPDSRSLVLVDPGENTGPVVAFVTLRLVDVDSGAVRWQHSEQLTHGLQSGLAVAVSPDGTRVAVEVDSVLSVYQGDTQLWGPIGIGGNWLAGPAAWTPDGSRLTILKSDGLLTYMNSAEGLKVDAVGYPALAGAARAPQLIGWRGGQPVVIAGNRVLLLGAANADFEGEVTQLLAAPEGSRELQIAAEALAKPLREPGPPQPGPALARYRFVLWDALKLLCATGVALLLDLRARRRRRRRAEQRWRAPDRPGR